MSSGKVSPVWVGFSDFNALLFQTFLAIALILFANIADLDNSDTKQDLQQELINTIGQQRLEKWQAEVAPDATVRFKNPEYLFDTGSSNLKPAFTQILEEFLPLYMKVLQMPRFKNKVNEIHIDGHSSAIWNTQTGTTDAYFLNLKLSQERTAKTLEYIVRQQLARQHSEWFIKKATSNGYSSSRPIVSSDTDPRNQRVEFKVILDNPLDSNQQPTPRKIIIQ